MLFNFLSDRSKKSMDHSQESQESAPSEPFFLFSKLSSTASQVVDQLDKSKLPKLYDKNLFTQRDSILKAFDNVSEKQLYENPPRILIDFFEKVKSVFKPEALHILLNTFPSVFPRNDEIINMVIFLVQLIHKAKDPKKVLDYTTRKFANKDWHKNQSKLVQNFRSAMPCKVNKRADAFDPNNFIWIVSDRKKNLFTYKVENGELISADPHKYTNAEVSPKGITFYLRKDVIIDTFVPISNDLLQEWERAPNVPFPTTLISVPKPIPLNLYEALYHAITEDDLLILRTLAHSSVTKIRDGIELSDALFNIFSYAGKVHPMLVALIGMEFENPSLSAATVLRSNSHLTNMFKTFSTRFGKKYYDNFLKHLVKYIQDNGDIGLADPPHANEKRVEKMLFTSLKNIAASYDQVPPEFKHICSILKQIAALRFNSKEAVFNAISAFFCLRFVTPILVDPSNFDENIKFDEKFKSSVMVPFSQLLQMPLNLTLLHSKMQVFSKWNERLKNHMFPKLKTFIYSLCSITEIPEYSAPSIEELQKSLDIVFQIITSNRENFNKRYRELLNNKDGRLSVIRWEFGSFISDFFSNSYDTV